MLLVPAEHSSEEATSYRTDRSTVLITAKQTLLIKHIHYAHHTHTHTYTHTHTHTHTPL